MKWHKKAMSNETIILIVIIMLALLTVGIIVYGLKGKLLLSP